MAHSYKRTLLASLGFADKDKQEPKHDLACEYVCLPHVAKKIIASAWKPIRLTNTAEPLNWDQRVPHREFPDFSLKFSDLGVPHREHLVSRGEGRYKTTIGFLDVVHSFRVSCHDPYGDPTGITALAYKLACYQDTGFERGCNLGVEVKAGRTPVSDILRQMKLYREHTDIRLWSVVTCYPISTQDAAALRSEGFTPVQLGALFEEWLSERREFTPAKDVEEF